MMVNTNRDMVDLEGEIDDREEKKGKRENRGELSQKDITYLCQFCTHINRKCTSGAKKIIIVSEFFLPHSSHLLRHEKFELPRTRKKWKYSSNFSLLVLLPDIPSQKLCMKVSSNNID